MIKSKRLTITKQRSFAFVWILILLYQSTNAQQKSNINLSLYDNPITSSIELIDSAKFKIQAVVYKFEEKSILSALVRAHNRGVKLRILVDGKEIKNKRKNRFKFIRINFEVLRWTHHSFCS